MVAAFCTTVEALPKLGNLELKCSALAKMPIRITKVQLTTSAPILAMPC